jgi:hypothetical protein
MQDSFNFKDEMTFEEKDLFWNLLYGKVSDAVRRKIDFTIVFHLSEKGLEDEEGYSIIIHKDDYQMFLKNFLLWSEENERYEVCLETKKLLKELESW